MDPEGVACLLFDRIEELLGLVFLLALVLWRCEVDDYVASRSFFTNNFHFFDLHQRSYPEIR
jgi:hypothetical protein